MAEPVFNPRVTPGRGSPGDGTMASSSLGSGSMAIPIQVVFDSDGPPVAARVLAQLSRPLSRPDPLDAIAPPLRHVSPDVPPMFAASAYERGGAHASG